MRNLYVTTALLLAAFAANAQNFFLEDFNDCSEPPGWTNTIVTGDDPWLFGNNAAGSPAGNVDGSCMAYFHDDDLTGAAAFSTVDLTSPVIDISSLDTALLQFDYVFEDLGTSFFAVALWDGAEWDTVLVENTDPGCFGFFPTCGPRSASIDLSDYLISDFQINFIYDDGDGWNWFIGLDNVAIYVPPTDDAVAVEEIAPESACGLSATEMISLIVLNNGQNDITSIDAGYEVGAQTASETFSVTIPSGESDTINFVTPVDMSTPGGYDFSLWIELTGDQDASNDTVWFTVDNIPVISSLPYSEGFESGNGFWNAGGTNSTWELGAPANTNISEANNGVNAWVTNLTGDYVLNELSYVESPCFDFSSLTIDPVFRFAHIFDTENCCDEGYVDISLDGGANWSRLGVAGEGENWYDDAVNNEWDGTGSTSGGTEWRTAEHLLDNAAGEGAVKIRIGFSSDGSIQNEGFGFDDIEIFEQPAVNAGVNEILSPLSGCGLGTELVTVVIENSGDDFLVDFNIEYDAGSGPVTQLITDTLYSAEIDTITFTVPVDLSTIGTYDFAAWTAVVGDGDPGNDTLATTINNIPVLSSLPYTEGFESGPAGWITGGTASSWELGDPAGVFIDTANTGINAWVTNLDGDYNISEQSYIESPCFDFSALVIDPILEFAQIYNTESCCDEGFVDISVDGGITWNRLGAAGEGENWYNDAANNEWDGDSGPATEWRNAIHLLDGTAGESSVKIRIGFSSDGSIQNEGFGVDDFSITEQPPVNSELTSIPSPVSACSLTAAEQVLVEVTNLGSLSMDSVIVGFLFDGGTAFTEVFDSTLAPNASATFTFSQTIDLSNSGDYDLTVWTGTIGDGDTSNDTLSIVVSSVPTISTIPYAEDFESGTGGWTSTGAELAWELGDPEGTLIDTAFSGVNAWATNLNQLNYENFELSYLESPCFDFSAEADDPIIQFAIQYDSEPSFDGGWLEVSIDGGTTWTTVGNVGEGQNWYTEDAFGNLTINIDQGWEGQSGQNGEWVIAENILTGVAGQADVKVRYVFQADDIINGFEGFAVDDISIFPQPQLDLVAISMDAPTDGCNLDQEEVTMTFWNKGLMSVSNFDLGFVVDAGTPQTETYTGTVNNGDTVTYTFTSEFADLSTAGVHTVDVFTALSGDEDMSTDSLFGNAVENYGSSTPLAQTEMPVEAVISSTIATGTYSEIFFCGLPNELDGCLEIVSVSIDSLAHTWLSDIDMFLISPAGDTLELSTDNGGAGDNMVDVVFTDTATTNIISQTAGILPGYYFPEDSAGFASLYNGQDPNGAWTLWIQDDLGGDDGELVSWSMTFQDNSPMPVLAQGDTTICITQVLTIGIESTYDSYLWTTGNNTQEIDLFGNILGLGTTEVSVTVDQDGCSGTSESFMLTVDACAGIDELAGLNIDMYPNPTAGNIVLDIAGESNGFNLEIVDVNGKVVYTETIGEIVSGLRRTIDLSNVANGLYFLRLDDGTSSTTRKLIKQ